MRPTLDFVVPTYNRASHLRALLDVLRVELAGLDDRVTVVIGDNASTDETPEFVHQFAAAYPSTLVLRHATNVGPEENFCRCIEAGGARYFWIFGDDDLPRAGLIRSVVQLLERNAPDLTYINSRWSSELTDNEPGSPITALDALQMDRMTFARVVHVWTTFISGMVVRRELASTTGLRRFAGTSLVQLGWVFEALVRGERFVHIRSTGVLATAGNTGGYRVLKVFGSNFQWVVRQALSGSAPAQRMADAIVARTTVAFLPNLVWEYRRGKLGNFSADECLTDTLAPEVRRSMAYWLFLLPIERLPLALAAVPLRVSALLARVSAARDQRRPLAAGTMVRI